VQRVIKEEREEKYMKRELGECFKLFLRCGTICFVVRRKRRRRNRRSICKIEDKILKLLVISGDRRVYYEEVR
jgi:hypothetical protein